MLRTTKSVTAMLLAPAAIFTATMAQADEIPRPNYNYIDIGYVYSEANFESDAIQYGRSEFQTYLPTGISLKGSVVFGESILVRGSFYGGEGEWKKSAYVGSSSIVGGIGWLMPTTDSTGIDVSIDYRADKLSFVGKFDNTIDPLGWDEEITGPGISFGIRSAPTEHIEFGVRAGWYEGDYNGAIGIGANLGWNFDNDWGINLTWDRIDADVFSGFLDRYELNQYGLAGRFYF